ncbi:MAG: glycosyltransferase [Lachnospiraceae bacterium]|nr:glycosyltransferase [Lachnospiraceae bacterium]
MKIACIAYLHGFGGAEKQIIMLANELAERGHDVTLISLCGDEQCYKISDKVRYIFLPDRKSGILSIASRYIDLMKTLKKIKPDVSVNFWFQPTYLTVLMPKSITGQVIYSERGDPGDSEYSGLLGLVRTLTLPFVQGFVFQSKGAADYFGKSVKKRSVIISNPVNIGDGFETPSEREKFIISVGRLAPQKNQKLLIKAFSLAADRIPEYKLVFYGDGELKEELEKYISELGLNDRILIHDAIPNVLNEVNKAALFVLSSDYEGMPNALMEAMALGVPSISTDCKPGGAKALIRNGVNGIIVPRNNPSKLADRIVFMLKNPGRANEMGMKAKIISKTHSHKAVYDKWESFLKSIREK